jgi:ferritin
MRAGATNFLQWVQHEQVHDILTVPSQAAALRFLGRLLALLLSKRNKLKAKRRNAAKSRSPILFLFVVL